MQAIVRPPGAAFRDALSGHPERERIDPQRALRQHEAYVAALRSAGLAVLVLSPEPALPDACFVSDTVLALPRAGEPHGPAAFLVIARPGALSRRPEVASVAGVARRLVGPGARVVEIVAPGTLEAGDVIRFGDRLAIGVSARTDAAGAEQLAAAARELGYRAFLCPVSDRLHLATAVSALGPRRLVGTAAGYASLDAAGPDVAPRAEIQRLQAPEEELPAANVLAVGGRCLVAAGNPRTIATLRAAGETVVELELDEFTRADGGPTCLVALVP